MRALPETDAKVETKSGQGKTENEEFLEKQLSMGKLPSVGESTLVVESLKEGNDGSKPMDNLSTNHETSHEPEAPPDQSC